MPATALEPSLRVGGIVVSAVMLSLVAASGCGRAEVIPVGEPGGACYPNATCNASAVCVSGECLARSALGCPTHACSGHGRCLVLAGVPTCACDPGFAPSGLTCLPCPAPDCATGPCPVDMALASLGGESFCIDRYEMTLFDSPTCTGTRFGAQVDDLPPGFPDLVASIACEGDCWGYTTEAESTPVYACSVAGFLPSEQMTWFQTKRACENVGKRLCSDAEFRAACGGTERRDYPYGSVLEPTRCNDETTGRYLKAATGEFTGCEGSVPGLFDMVGNLGERTLDGVNGGDFASHGGAPTCASIGGFDPAVGDWAVGGRCCRTL